MLFAITALLVITLTLSGVVALLASVQHSLRDLNISLTSDF